MTDAAIEAPAAISHEGTSSRIGAWSEWSRTLAVGVGAMVVSRVVVLFGVYARAVQVANDRVNRRTPVGPSLRPIMEDVLSQFEGRWYLLVADQGYPSELPNPIPRIGGTGAGTGFFPAYPYLARFVDVIAPGDLLAAMLGVNFLLSMVAVILVGLLAREAYDVQTAQRAMLLFAFFPGSVVLSWSYAEPLLIVCAAACSLFLLREQWVLAGLVAAVGTAAHPNGIAIVAGCLVAAVIAISRKRQWRSLLGVAVAPLGGLGFHIYLGVHTGEWGAWLRARREVLNEGWSWGASVIRFTWRFLENPLGSAEGHKYTITALALAAAVFGAYCSIRKRVPLPLLAYVVVILLLMIGSGNVSARPRLVFTAFPLAIGVAAWWPRRSRHAWNGLMLLSAGGLAALAIFYGSFSAVP